ncbi:hypothetical protein ACOQFV_08575 [Nocardiopsis changdeensis]|uniref:Uncharacterized protein n=1 Tax=Nocardiopsis changdeensis TaxID=2831969 RepID=A0ABX8BF61_9ACTN|nr:MULTISPECIES: hypothetical protein [Nocardiopsis]QUX20395.1 hypothetical protein KGD84_17905 [Nocardiopsis changdeensis]QYX36325.1 hypothetical protein K1J57_27360 [Nocardiopsis sp. MT53]
MGRPEVGAALRRCAECGGYEYAGAPACGTCRALVDGVVEEGWAGFVEEFGGGDEVELAAMVADEPDRHDWRVVDAALDRLTCADCGERTGRGPLGCAPCDLAHGFRYVAIERDRPGVPPGNEHAVRVNVSVVRRPHVTSANELLLRRLTLPGLLVGLLPTTEEAQRLAATARQVVVGPERERTVELMVEEMFSSRRVEG